MTDEQRVDPRYDPAFQRGFEGSVTSSVRSRQAPQRDAIVTPAPFRQPEATEPQPEVAPTRSAAVDEPEPTPEHDAVPVAARRLTRNPYLVAVTLLGVIMVGGGAAWANQARGLVSGRGVAATDLDYWFLEATVVGAPLTIVAGILILAGVLFMAATAWNRR